MTEANAPAKRGSISHKIAWGVFSFLAGAALVCGAATVQFAIVLEVALLPHAFVVPFLIGGTGGLAIGSLILALQRWIQDLEIETDRSRRTEEALRESEEELRDAHEQLTATLNALPDLLFEVDREGRIHDVRAPNPDLLYAPLGVLLGVRVSDILPADAARTIAQAIAETAETGLHRGATYSLKMPTGLNWFELSIAAKGGNTSEARFVALVRDITERKQAEESLQEAHDELERRVKERTAELVRANEELNREVEDRTQAEQIARQSEERFFKAFHAAPNGIAIFTLKEGRLVDVNDDLLRTTGYTRDEVIGNTKIDLGLWSTPEDRIRVVQKLQAGKGVVRHQKVLLRAKSGELRRCALSMELIDIEGGECLLTMIDDVTERERMTGALRRADRLRSLGTLVAGIAHEINNPVGAALLAAETALVIKDEPENAEQLDRCLKNVTTSLDRCRQIIRNMLTFSKDEPVEKRPCQIGEVIQQSRDLTRSYAGRYQTAIQLALDRDLPEVVIGRLDMELALTNLLRNAIKAGGDGGQVVVRAERADAAVWIIIEDNGCGMTSEQKKHVFDPFYTTWKTHRGTGLGLSITHSIIQDHGGTIEVDSTPGEGTTMTVTLPVSGVCS